MDAINDYINKNYKWLELNLELFKCTANYSAARIRELKNQYSELITQNHQLERGVLQITEATKLYEADFQRSNALEQQKQQECQEALGSLQILANQLSLKQKSFILQSAIADSNEPIIKLLLTNIHPYSVAPPKKVPLAFAKNNPSSVAAPSKKVPFTFVKTFVKVFQEVVSDALNFDHNFQNGSDKSSMLHTAIKYNHAILLLKVMRNAATLDLNKVDNDSATPLLMAVQKENFKLAFNLINHNADIHIADRYGNSPASLISEKFFEAISNGNEEFIGQLLPLPIDLANFTDKNTNQSPLYFALKNNKQNIAQLLFSQKMAASGIHTAIVLDNDPNLAVIRELLNMGAAKDQLVWQNTPLVYLSLKEGKLPIAQLLSEGSMNKLSMFLAINENNPAVVGQLLSFEAGLLNALSPEGFTPLMLAIQQQKPEIVTLLQAQGADLLAAISSTSNASSINLTIPLNSAAVLCLSEALGHNQALIKLALDNAGIQAQDLETITIALSTNQSLKSLSVSGNNLGEEGAQALSKFLEQHPSLRSLKVSNIALDLRGIHEISKALENNLSLTLLDLSNNNLGTGMAHLHLKKIIENCRSLLQLDLNENNLTDPVFSHTAPFIGKHKALVQVNLKGNPISHAGLDNLTNALGQNCSLVKLELSGQDSQQFTAALLNLASTGKAILSLGQGNVAAAEINNLLAEKREALKTNLQHVVSINLEQASQLDESMLTKAFIAFKQLQFKVLTDENPFQPMKKVFKKIDSFMHQYEQTHQESEMVALFAETLEKFGQDYDYIS
jgi:hypothetical protein